MNPIAMTEKEITRNIRIFLKTNRIFHWKVWQGLGSEKGVADILGIYEGRPLAIEVKTAKGRLSDHQLAFLQRFHSEGGIVILARGVDDVHRALNSIRVRREGIIHCPPEWLRGSQDRDRRKSIVG